jgi:hypothetical protein
VLIIYPPTSGRRRTVCRQIIVCAFTIRAAHRQTDKDMIRATAHHGVRVAASSHTLGVDTHRHACAHSYLQHFRACDHRFHVDNVANRSGDETRTELHTIVGLHCHLVLCQLRRHMIVSLNTETRQYSSHVVHHMYMQTDMHTYARQLACVCCHITAFLRCFFLPFDSTSSFVAASRRSRSNLALQLRQ